MSRVTKKFEVSLTVLVEVTSETGLGFDVDNVAQQLEVDDGRYDFYKELIMEGLGKICKRAVTIAVEDQTYAQFGNQVVKVEHGSVGKAHMEAQKILKAENVEIYVRGDNWDIGVNMP